MTTTVEAPQIVETVTADVAVLSATFNPSAALASIDGTAPRKVVSTFAGNDEDVAMAIFGAVSDAEQISDHIGEVIALENVVFQYIVIEDEITKAPVELIRTILLDADGSAYATTSETIFKSLETMFSILGKPETWKSPKNVSVVEKKAKLGKFFSLVPVTVKKASK